MQINSMDAHLTSDAMERVSRWDRREGPELQLISAGGALVVLARGSSAELVLGALKPLLSEFTLGPVAVEEPPPRETVQVTTGVRSAGVTRQHSRSK